MNSLTNTIQNSALEHLTSRAPKQVLHAIQDASARVGVSFSYMVEQANAESSFKADAKAKTSSASGLYQFIESTWMNMVEKYGDKHGVETAGKSKSELLELRNDPAMASLMAAEFAGENKAYLERNWAKGTKEIGSTELYFAHFMGAGGAASFLNARDNNPMQEAAVLFPKAAKANKNVFYDMQTGRARTMDEVYAFFDKKFSGDSLSSRSAVPADSPLVSSSRSGLQPDSPLVPNRVKPVPSAMNAIPQHYGQISAAHFAIPRSAGPLYNLISNPIDIMMMTQLDLPFGSDSDNRNSIF